MTRREVTQLPSSALQSAGRSDVIRLLSKLLALGLLLFILALVLAPWQQSVRGQGRVIAYAPVERQQSVQAPIDGRIEEVFVQEGSRVKKGEPIVALTDNDPEILSRIRRERDAAQVQVDTAELAISLTEARIMSLETARQSAISNAELKVRMASDRRTAAAEALDAAKATKRTAELNLTRQQGLQQKGLTSQRDFELAQLDAERSRTEMARARAALRAADSEVKALDAEQSKIASSAHASIASARSSLEKLRADKAKAEGELAKVEVKLARQQQMQVAAPREGTILKLLVGQGAQMVKSGDPIALIVPEAASRAVELYVDGNDAPLVGRGRHVRLQFEGWPALQFVGWPSVAVGTFPGEVAFVDAHGDGQGRFRVVVVPESAEAWPGRRYLRQGVRVNGWVLLNQVKLGYELWRQFNGFPPVVTPITGDQVEKEKKK